MKSKINDIIYKSARKIRSEKTLDIFNFVTNNSDIILISPNLYLGNIKSSQNINILKEYNINSIVNCSNDIPFHDYFNNKNIFRIDIEDSKELENINKFKSNILNATLFIDEQINNNNNVMVHCYWGLMRSPTVIASYLMYKYKMDVESSIQFIKDKKNLSFHSLYNFKEILYYVKEELDKIVN